MKGVRCLGGLLLLALASLPVAAEDLRVPVEGAELRVRLLGEGSPTVIFEAGGGDGLDTWGNLLDTVAEHRRVVAYDRAGLGESPPGQLPRNADRIAHELHAILKHLEVEPPFLLVGHSLGGLYIRAFAHLVPEQVAGFVFVDPTTEGMHRSLFTEEGHAAYLEKLEPLSPGVRAEGHSFRDNMLALEEKYGNPPDRPAVVLTAAAPVKIPEEQREALAAMGLTEERLHELRELKSRLCRALTDRLPRGQYLEAQKSGHYIHHDEPELVLQAIETVAREAREDSSVASDSP